MQRTTNLVVFLEENPGGMNLTAATKEISAHWKLLSDEDCIIATTECMQEIEEEREARSLASHNVPLRAFHDARSTIQAVEKDVSNALCRSDHNSIDVSHSDSYPSCMRGPGLSSCLSLAGPIPRIL